MKSIIQLLIISICLVGFQYIGISQTDNHHLHTDAEGHEIDKFYLPYTYSGDSLAGFDEVAALQYVEMNTSEVWMQERLIAALKYDFVNYKYSAARSGGGGPTVQAPCTNVDFETGNATGWTLTQGPHTNSQTMAGCCPTANTANFQVVGPGNDVNVGAALQRVPPGGGNFSLLLGRTGTGSGGLAFRARQTFQVTAANSIFVYSYAVVLNAAPHSCTEQPFFNIKFTDANNNIIPCSNYAVTAIGSSCSSGDASFITSGSMKYKPWQTSSFDLTSQIGSNVTIEFTVGGCVASQGAHGGYAYIDARCQPMTLNLNGTDIPVGQTTTNFCAIGTNTLCAPPGFTSYTWNGPGGATGLTSQCISANVAGTYSVTLGMAGNSCDSPVLYSSFNIVPKPTADFTFTTTACQSSFVVPFSDNSSPNGGPALTNWTWDFNNDGVPDDLTQNPSNDFLTAGTYSVELKVSNGGCTDSIVKVVSVSPSVIGSFTNTSGCLNTSTNFTATSTPTAGITSHVWNFGDGSANGTGANPVHTYTTSGVKNVTYTVTNSSGCTSVITKTLEVFPNPVMAITANTVCLNVATTFGNTSAVAAPATISNWAWDFDNNGSIDNTTQTPSNTYTAAGNYVAVLTATTNNGCVNTTSVTVKINPLPTATFTPVNACLNSNVVLNNTSSIAAPDNISTYAWNFGVGASPATGAIANVTPLVYTTAGIKNITLNLTSNNTCTATITQTVEVYAQPVANFSTTSVCQGTATAYTDLSTPTGSITGWAWDFTNNGSVDNATTAPTNIFSPSGTYTTSLIVTDNHGCKDTIALPVNVWGHAIPDFSPTNVCFGTSSTFSNTTNTSTNANVGGTPTWAWNFGDGSAINTLQDPTYTYTSTGITSYSVVLTATTTNGCVDNITKVVTVNVIPTATFTPVNACLNTNVLLNNSSTVPLPDNISSYAWNFGTGAAPTTTSAVQNPPLLTYNSSGVKTITLTITANTTCSASITQTVTVYPQPIANFSTTSVCQGTATAYTDMSTPTGSITAWSWDFTNNGSVDNTTNAPTNTYPTSGTFTTSLIVTDNNTCKDTIALAVDVWGHTIPNFTPDKVCFGTASLFTNLTDETTNPNVGLGSTYVWDFADTSPTTTILNPNHTYTLGGNVNATYNVTLTATSLHGCLDVIVKPVSIYAIPTASFTSDSVCLGSPSHLTDASNGNGNAINAYMWDYLNDGTVDVTGVSSPNFVFPAFGNNSVSYTVSTSPVVGLVCSNTTNTIQVWVNPLPQPDFTFVNKCINAQPNTFNGSSSNIAIGTNTAYVWAYGDGSVSTPTVASTSTHTYAAAGIYNTTLTVTSNKGCQASITKAVQVYEKPNMLITNSTPCDGAAMTFTAVSQPGSGTVSNWFWDFNNSVTSIEGAGQTTNFTFAGPGDYTIHLVSETNNGCRDTLPKFVYVNYLPQPDFTVDDPDGCPKHCVTFTDLTPAIPGPAQNATWTWTLGDGSNPVSNNSNATVAHCYNNSSSSQLAQYNVQLMVTTSAGCSVTVTKSNYITVFPKPIANYVVNPNPSNVTEPLVYFTNQSQDYTNWWWLFGDNSPLDSVNVNPEHYYSDVTAQTYYSVLLVENQYGCTDTAFVPVEIGPEFTFYIPNAFSPANNDGVNDYFNGKGIGIAKYEMWVFDRWGERVFYTDDINKGWDGRVQGKTPEGKQEVYVWKVKLTDVLGKKHEYIGHVTLLK
jgi:gliding motility-associated-like protein